MENIETLKSTSKDLETKYYNIYTAKQKDLEQRIKQFVEDNILGTKIKSARISRNYLSVNLVHEFLSEISIEYSGDYDYETHTYKRKDLKINWACVGSTNSNAHLDYIICVSKFAQLVKDKSVLLEPIKGFFEEYIAIEKDEELIKLKTEFELIKEQIHIFEKENKTKRYLEILNQGYVESPNSKEFRIYYGAGKYDKDYGYKYEFKKNEGRKTYTLIKHYLDRKWLEEDKYKDTPKTMLIKDNVKGEYIEQIIKQVIEMENQIKKKQNEAA